MDDIWVIVLFRRHYEAYFRLMWLIANNSESGVNADNCFHSKFWRICKPVRDCFECAASRDMRRNNGASGWTRWKRFSVICARIVTCKNDFGTAEIETYPYFTFKLENDSNARSLRHIVFSIWDVYSACRISACLFSRIIQTPLRLDGTLSVNLYTQLGNITECCASSSMSSAVPAQFISATWVAVTQSVAFSF